MNPSQHWNHIIKLKPPRISSETISEEIVCTRPMREGKFNISIEPYHTKVIVNCYGHGGSGWTTSFGSVFQAIELYQATHPNSKNPIRIIGSGCMGLTSAIELVRRGFAVAGISTISLYDAPSWRAAGYFALVSIKTSPDEHSNLKEIGLQTFLTYQAIHHGKHPYITQDAVRFLPVYCSLKTESGVEDLEARGMIPPKEYVSLDFGNGVIHHDYVKYMTYFLDTTALMRQLAQEAARLNIALKMEQICSFDQVAEEVIFNCTGLNGRELTSDVNIIPVRGHFVTLNAHAGTAHMDYMIYTKVKQEEKDEYLYMFPKNHSVTAQQQDGVQCMGALGGTFIPHVDQLSHTLQDQLDRIEFKRLLDRNSLFFQGKPFERNHSL